MSKASAAILFIIVGLLPSHASPKSLSIEIHWSGAAPSDVLLDRPGGFISLRRDGAARVFRGELQVSGDAPQRHTITVRYGSYYHPFDIRVHRFLPSVTFAVDHQSQKSCTLTRVELAGGLTDNLPDAINRSVNAGELLSIAEPNRCDSSLQFAAVRAKYRQNVRMTHLSNGFFLINRETENEYKEMAAARGVPVDKEVAAYDRQDKELEAKQLITVRASAQAEGNYSLALQVNDYISDRVSADASVASLYRKQGVTTTGLASDATYLQALANAPPLAAATDTLPVQTSYEATNNQRHAKRAARSKRVPQPKRSH